jgi:hypothetical protein
MSRSTVKQARINTKQLLRKPLKSDNRMKMLKFQANGERVTKRAGIRGCSIHKPGSVL